MPASFQGLRSEMPLKDNSFATVAAGWHAWCYPDRRMSTAVKVCHFVVFEPKYTVDVVFDSRCKSFVRCPTYISSDTFRAILSVD